MCKTKHIFFYDSHFKTLLQPKCCGDLIDNRTYEPIFVLDYNERVTKKIFKRTLKFSLVDCEL